MRGSISNFKKGFAVLLITGAVAVLSGQDLQSNTVRFRLNNTGDEKKSSEVGFPDASPPVINFVSHEINPDEVFETSEENLDLVGEIKDNSKIEYFSVNSEIREISESGMFYFSLNLKPGINQVHLMAVDQNKNIQKQVISIEFTPRIVSLADRIKYKSKYYGLIIGIDDYEDPMLPDLDNPIKDAEKLYSTLVENYTFEPENVQVLRNPKRIDIIRELDALRTRISSEDNLLLFYAGHGYWDEQAMIGYWLPSDASSDITADWFRNSTLVDYIKAIGSKHTLLITDACFAGSIFKARSVNLNRETVYERIYDMPSRKAMTSGTLTEVPDQSAFLKYLIKNLEENQEVFLSSEQLFSSFKMAVISNSNAVPQFGEIQNVGNEGGDFIFLKRD